MAARSSASAAGIRDAASEEDASGFAPFRGELDTEDQWFLDVGDNRHVRLGKSSPSRPLRFGSWTPLRSQGKKAAAFDPVVTLRIDLTALARQLRPESSETFSKIY